MFAARCLDKSCCDYLRWPLKKKSVHNNEEFTFCVEILFLFFIILLKFERTCKCISAHCTKIMHLYFQ